ncbi:feruloyl esterase [Geodermatophilus africanus]|uniref:Feruloyl esterase n=1 Tax=Geodermatophilus africanus TaxID=1137993 RepID=A0A1H3JZN3_9ACTN|nr:tannase/feruloyl esterase family alpha/beta hydrolase [Geodermatophilus africanus]SDY45386.1 feruloyl esterase [Geodermatophilus africanus]
MDLTRARTAAAGVALAVVAALGWTTPAGAADAAERCAALAGVDVPARAIGLPTTGGEVTEATLVAPSGTGVTAIGEYCRVSAALHPVDPAAPDIRMQVALPTTWNHKALMFGGGGYNGTIPALDGNVPFGPTDAPQPLGRGYATFASDSGHQTPPGFLPTASLYGEFLANDEALRNFAGDALKKTRDAAVFLIGRYYDRDTPQQTYFAGGSTGGREALAVAQRWERDFDGVISVYPAFNAATLDLYFGHMTRQLAAPGAFPRPAQQVLLYNAVIADCDDLDGLVDGVVSNEPACDFDPVVLRCPEGQDLGDGCLSDPQITAIRAISSAVTFPYPLASGETGYPGFPYLSGADMSTPLLGLGTTAPATPMPKTAGYGMQFWDAWVKYAVTRDPGFDSLSLDPLAPGPWEERISELTALQDVNSTDLRPFARRGGKLLLLHGTADELVSHRATVEYYEGLVQTMGERRVDAFARFYLVPGANHANLAAAFAAGWDSLTALDRWVTTGAAPADPVVRDTNPGATRTRPLCEYPAHPQYSGTGSPDEAGSFACVKG